MIPRPLRCRRRRVSDYLEDLDEITHELAGIRRGVGQLVFLAEQARIPSRITLTASLNGDTVLSNQFPEGHPIVITADVENAEHVAVPDTLTYTTTSGAIATDASTLTATLTGAALGQVTVTATDALGLSASITVEVVDPTPASIALSAALG